MSRILVAALTLVLLFTVPAGAQEQEQQQPRAKPGRDRKGAVEHLILQLEGETMEAIKNKDAGALGRILADDFVLRSPAGPDLSRAEFLNLVKTLPVRILSVQGDHLRVNVYQGTAVLTGVQRSRTESDDGKEETSAQAFTDIFVRRQGRWLLVLAYAVDLPAERPSAPQLRSLK